MKPVKTGYRTIICALACTAGIFESKADFLREGRDAFMKYDFELASECYDKYAKSLKKNPDAHGEELLEQYIHQLEIAENSLENVQQIEIIDRMDVPSADFFKYIKLPQSGGKLLPPDGPVLNKRHNLSDFVYTSESGDIMVWSENDENHLESIMQSERLMDGSWENAEKADEILNDGGNARNPFLLADGLTLYYSSNGDGSMGGYDLFVATKDPVSGEYRQPIGLGYPFNSPFNEYMIAIDEENGIGWWVTDRNRLDGQVSIYIFKTNDIRKNYKMDEEEDIISLATLSDITIAQNPETDYASILKGIDERNKVTVQTTQSDFVFPLPGGRIARHISDFSSANAKRSMQQYLEAQKENSELERKLTALRKQYHKGATAALKNQILDMEKKRDWQAERLKKMRNNIISAETKQ